MSHPEDDDIPCVTEVLVLASQLLIQIGLTPVLMITAFMETRASSESRNTPNIP